MACLVFFLQVFNLYAEISRAPDSLPSPRTAKRGRGSEIKLSHSSGFYNSKFSLKLDTRDEELTIYYTTNGSLPSLANGIRYVEPIQVATTMVFRAAGFHGQVPETAISAGTFLFAADVLKQTGAGFPSTWGIREGQPVVAHYAMAPEITENPLYKEAVVEGLKSLASLSILTDPGNLFQTESGIYMHPLDHGGEWERPVSIEMISPGGRPGFIIDCGLRIHGGWSRRPEESPKHSFRLIFRKRYGSAKLNFPLFGSAGAQQFDTLILRAGNNNSWLHPSAEERRRADYLRDQWMRDSMGAMGYPSGRGIFVHLYLDGLYWGLYNLCEEPGPSGLPANDNGSPISFDSRKADKIEAGDAVVWKKLMALAESGLGNDQRYQAICQLLDLPEFADYLILNFYAGNSDWDRSSNWYAIRPRNAGGKFRFFVWDAERTLEDIGVNTLNFDDEESPPHLFQKLSENSEFRRLFAQRVERLLFTDGPLASAPAAERFRILAASIEKAVVAESARWGTYRRDVNRFKTGPYEAYTLNEHWRPEITRILTQYFPQRGAIVVKQFQERGLAP